MDIPRILDRVRPGAAWGWRGEDKSDLRNLEWRDQSTAAPDLPELEAAWEDVLAESGAIQVNAQAVAANAARLAGRTVASLSAAELRELLELQAILAGGVDLATRTVRHPDTWPVVRDVLGGVSFLEPSPPPGFWARVWARLTARVGGG